MSQELFNKNNGDAEDIWDDTAMIEMYEKSKSATMEKVKLSASQTQGKTREWKVDDTCMAPYEDGRWYPAKVLSLDGETCRVVYTEYDEEADVNVADLLSEEAVEKDAVDKMDTNEEEKPGPSTEQKPTTSKLFPIPSICPPPPALFAKIAKSSNEKEALTNMLMSWYMSGYHTGFYEGFKEAQKSVQLGKRK